MARIEAHVGDIGFEIELIVTEAGSVVDLSTASATFIKLRTPDGRLLLRTATFTTDGTDGAIQYQTTSGDLNVPGQWRSQGYIQGLGGWTGHTSEGQPFHVRQSVG